MAMIARYTDFTRAALRFPVIATLLWAAGMIVLCAHAEPAAALRKQFQEHKAKAEKGDAEAQNSLGVCYANGRGVAKDEVASVKWYQKAAEQNLAAAQFNLGLSHATGRGVEKDYAEAVIWFRKAAGQNLAAAQYNLGVCYDVGQGVEKDYNEAVKLYRQAAEQGYDRAQNNLGLSYEDGNGVEKDHVEAYAWYNLAATTYEASAKHRDDLEKKMTPQQVTAGQKRAKELRAQIEARLASGGK